MVAKTPAWLQKAVSTFGAECKAKLAGPGDREAAIRSPLEALLKAVGERLKVEAVFHDEVRDAERQVRPDYGVSVDGAITGYVEIKAPGHTIDPAKFTGHDKRQWERQSDLPNLVYTNGIEWRLYRDKELIGTARLGSDLARDGYALDASEEFESLLTNFLRWKPAPITSVGALVRAIAPLTRLLRGEVLDQLAAEHRLGRNSPEPKPFTGLAQDWRTLLFPQASDSTFADGYAQTVTFALLLARTEGIQLGGSSLHEIGAKLGSEHSLMGKALQLLTDDVAADFKVTLDLLVRVVDAVDWFRIHRGQRDTYLHLYEDFLDLYDNDLRKASGSYYTPREVVQEMVRLTEEVLVTRLGKERGFWDPDVFTVDPAMGTGTFLHTLLERVAEQAAAADGPGSVPGVLSRVAERMVGFELQTGPYAVAELRTNDLLKSHGARPPAGGMRLYVTDTLDDPYAADTQLGSGLQLIARSRNKANDIKKRSNVTVVIGNPPYHERAEGLGGWVEKGSDAHANARRILDDFRMEGNGRTEYVLKNLYVYFWRWATWKVWESTSTEVDGDVGVVCFITTSGYLRGPGFKGMREYLRRTASQGWIIDLTPEGQTPDVPTRIFPGVRQPLSIGLFIREPDTDRDKPATIHYQSVSGRQHEKFHALKLISIDGEGWREARTDWTSPLTPAADSGWDGFPAVSDLMPWAAPGVKPNRTWVYAPHEGILTLRWERLTHEPDLEEQKRLFRESDSANMLKTKDSLPGSDTYRATGPFKHEHGPMPKAVRVGYRAFDRQWIIPDSRLIHRPSPDLWSARKPGQVFVVEQHANPINNGPGLLFSGLIPDMDHFNQRGGRVLPLFHPSGEPNLAHGLLRALSRELKAEISASDMIAYLAAIVAHPAFTQTFADELTTPGIRVPITGNGSLWKQAVKTGAEVLQLHTFGQATTKPDQTQYSLRYPLGDGRQPLCRVAVSSLPREISYRADRQSIRLGDGEFSPVSAEVWKYEVGSKNVIKSWFNYRKKNPGGKKTSDLDLIHLDYWPDDWTTEFIDLLTVLSRLVDLEPEQAELLSQILTGPLLDMRTLQHGGTVWPSTPKDRKPHYDLSTTVEKESSQTSLLDL